MANPALQTLQQLREGHYVSLLKGIKRGIEKESLRVNPEGEIAQTQHPEALGSALTHGSITTDYSEALLEFITPVYQNIEDNLNYLRDLHAFTYQNIGDELLWSSSMPCLVQDELSIPIAQYGRSNIGQLKHVYRHGLWHRYGRIMQTISGIHYNFSLPDEFFVGLQALRGLSGSLQDARSDFYFGLIRNVRRYSWMLMYLFGASPALCACFLQGKSHPNLKPLDKESFFLPYGTSLRMSDLGYQNNAQSDLKISYRSLETYTKTLEDAIHTPYEAYEKIGVQDQGIYKQLNSNLLQIENEYYSDIRPKRVARSGQKPIQALREGGVEYLELRSLDVNPFLGVGIDATQSRFLDVFLVFCLLRPSDDIQDKEADWVRENHQRSVYQGRDPALKLFSSEPENFGQPVLLRQWASEVMTDLLKIADEMDEVTLPDGKADEGIRVNGYREAVAKQIEKIKDDRLTPSSLILTTMQQHQQSYFQFSVTQSQRHKTHFQSRGIEPRRLEDLVRQAQQSVQAQRDIEASDHVSFHEFLTNYLNQA